MLARLMLFFLVLSLCGAAHAKDFYVDPSKGIDTNDGSQAKPWKSLQAVLDGKLVETENWPSLPYKAGMKTVPKNAGAPIKAGDTIWLMSGYHGTLSIISHYNKAVITVAAAPGQVPQFKTVLVRSSRHWVLRGLHISPSFAPTYEKKNLVVLENHAHTGPVEDVVLDSCQMYAIKDITPWTAKDWNDKAPNGIQVSGTRMTIRNNLVKNINFGISVTATQSTIENNIVENFAGDGLRGLGDDCVFQYNTVKNCYKVNDNHDDGFQSWSVGADGKVGTGVVKNVVLRGNTIINYTDAKQPMRCTLQGIGMFDGTFDNWVVENNVIIVDHWHGITLLGVKNSRVVNNTLMDPNDERPGPPWIQMGNHKNGTPPTNCIVRNNLVTALSNAKAGVKEDNNIVYKDATTHFVNPVAFDLHLLMNSPAIDKGSSDLAPKADRDKAPRPFGKAIDIGAYEWRDKPVPPIEPVDESAPDAGSPDLPMTPDTPVTSPDQASTDTSTRPLPDSAPQPDIASPTDTNRADTGVSQPEQANPSPDQQATESAGEGGPNTPPGGCGCAAADRSQGGGWLWLGLVLLAGLCLRRRGFVVQGKQKSRHLADD